MTEIKDDSPLPSAFCAMVTTLTLLLRYPNEFSSNVLALALYWFKDVLEYCGDGQFRSKEINEKIRKEFNNVIFSLVIAASKSYAFINDINFFVKKIKTEML